MGTAIPLQQLARALTLPADGKTSLQQRAGPHEHRHHLFDLTMTAADSFPRWKDRRRVFRLATTEHFARKCLPHAYPFPFSPSQHPRRRSLRAVQRRH
ncbi:hypothetical protein A0H81_07572 [Grifola frondosa]|uniref:Uncharacterized protein n=1 Tax=Grifola frondosa TaxID=5627 RepID=A0A1C7M6B5_GRIFR|nr:hypothetical protein A0H81_07572 [Grifola frondosa]